MEYFLRLVRCFRSNDISLYVYLLSLSCLTKYCELPAMHWNHKTFWAIDVRQATFAYQYSALVYYLQSYHTPIVLRSIFMSDKKKPSCSKLCTTLPYLVAWNRINSSLGENGAVYSLFVWTTFDMELIVNFSAESICDAIKKLLSEVASAIPNRWQISPPYTIRCPKLEGSCF